MEVSMAFSHSTNMNKLPKEFTFEFTIRDSNGWVVQEGKTSFHPKTTNIYRTNSVSFAVEKGLKAFLQKIRGQVCTLADYYKEHPQSEGLTDKEELVALNTFNT